MAGQVLLIPHDRIREIRTHLQACLPEEGCGLLGGAEGRVERVFPVRNVTHRADRFRMDPEQQIEGLLSLEVDGLELVAIYHSHPHGPDRPSSIDLAEAAYPEAAHLIFSSPETGWPVRAYRIADGSAREIQITQEPVGD